MERDRGKNRNEYIYALGHDGLTLLGNPIVRWTTRESTFKSVLIQQADLTISHRVLDLGCGTGILTLGIENKLAEGHVAGLDEEHSCYCSCLKTGPKDWWKIGIAALRRMGLKGASHSLLPRPRIPEEGEAPCRRREERKHPGRLPPGKSLAPQDAVR